MGDVSFASLPANDLLLARPKRRQKLSHSTGEMGGEAPLQFLPISVGINPTAEIGDVRHFVGIPKTDKMTYLLSGFPDPWGASPSNLV